jgi:SAM-dependent methyltransferase
MIKRWRTRRSKDSVFVRRRFGSYLSGEGIEVGPGHVPFPVPATATVRYIDRWEPALNSSLFPELGEDPGFPVPNMLIDLDRDRLAAIPDSSQDFVIASHVIEHLANPLAMLVEIYRVLRPGGLLVLLLPDRHLTHDREREPTPLSHVVDEYKRDVREVDDAHILDYIIGTLRATGVERETTPEGEIEFQRKRSVHAHVWDADEFGELMAFAAAELGLQLAIVDAMPTGAKGTYGDEFGWVFSKAQ